MNNCIKYKACRQAADEDGIKDLPCSTCKHYIPRPGTTESIDFRRRIKMKTKLTDLNDSLFAQLERLNNNELSKEDLATEITRAQAVCGVSTQIINNASLALKAHTTLNAGMTKSAPKMLGVTDGE
jgi:hypothetical protein